MTDRDELRREMEGQIRIGAEIGWPTRVQQTVLALLDDLEAAEAEIDRRRARSAASGQGDATWARLDGMATQADATVSDLTALLAEVEGAADE